VNIKSLKRARAKEHCRSCYKTPPCKRSKIGIVFHGVAPVQRLKSRSATCEPNCWQLKERQKCSSLYSVARANDSLRATADNFRLRSCLGQSSGLKREQARPPRPLCQTPYGTAQSPLRCPAPLNNYLTASPLACRPCRSVCKPG